MKLRSKTKDPGKKKGLQSRKWNRKTQDVAKYRSKMSTHQMIASTDSPVWS